MNHIYQNIPGWFGFTNFYSYIVNKFDNGIFVEIGAWLGRSTTYMAVEIINSNKNIKFYSVDTWEGCKKLKNNSLVTEKKLFDEYLKNIEPVKNVINVMKMTSIEASNQFENNSIDFCFIDGDHSYEDVKNDLEAWYKKVKINGILAGHDYPNEHGVVQAVEEFVQINKLKLQTSDDATWFFEKLK